METLTDQLLEERRRADQMTLNFNFLLEKIETIHEYLCADEKLGTWQQRAEQAVEAARKLA